MTTEHLEKVDHLNSFKKGKDLGHTPPHPEHYPGGYRWDSTQIAIARAILGDVGGARRELEEVLSWQNPKNGFIPNMKKGVGRRWDPESRTFKRPTVESDYPQPPLEAEAAWEIFQGYKLQGRDDEGKIFLNTNYGRLKKTYSYFTNLMENEDSPIIGVFHYHATGRDSGSDSDHVKWRLPNTGQTTPQAVRKVNTVLDYGSSLLLNTRMKRVNWDPEKSRKIFWMNDVMFNAIYARNLGFMSKIAEAVEIDDEKIDYENKANQVEEAMYSKMWDRDKNFFYSLDRKGEKIKKMTVSNLYPITLPNVGQEQAKRIVDMLNDENWFRTPFPIPSIPVWSRDYDPHYQEKRLWRGPTWVNTNLHIIEGLMLQSERFKDSDTLLADRCKKTATRIASSTIDMIEKNGFWEFFDPETGKGHRLKPFAWTVATYYTLKTRYADLLTS